MHNLNGRLLRVEKDFQADEARLQAEPVSPIDSCRIIVAALRLLGNGGHVLSAGCAQRLREIESMLPFAPGTALRLASALSAEVLAGCGRERGDTGRGGLL